MKITEKELEILIEYGFNQLLKPYSFYLYNIHLSINNKIIIKTKIKYNNKDLDGYLSFLLDYTHNQLRLYDIEGYVIYMKLNIPITSLLKSFVHDYKIKIGEYEIIYDIKLPINDIEIKENSLLIKIC